MRMVCAHGCAMRRAVCAYSCAMRRAVCAACAYSFTIIFVMIFAQILLYLPLRNAARRDGMCCVSMSLLCTVFELRQGFIFNKKLRYTIGLYDSAFVRYFNHGTIAQTLQMSPLGFGFGSSDPSY